MRDRASAYAAQMFPIHGSAADAKSPKSAKSHDPIIPLRRRVRDVAVLREAESRAIPALLAIHHAIAGRRGCPNEPHLSPAEYADVMKRSVRELERLVEATARAAE